MGGAARHPVWIVDAVRVWPTLTFTIHSLNSQQKQQGRSRATGVFVCVSLSAFSFRCARDFKTNSLRLVLKYTVRAQFVLSKRALLLG